MTVSGLQVAKKRHRFSFFMMAAFLIAVFVFVAVRDIFGAVLCSTGFLFMSMENYYWQRILREEMS